MKVSRIFFAKVTAHVDLLLEVSSMEVSLG